MSDVNTNSPSGGGFFSFLKSTGRSDGRPGFTFAERLGQAAAILSPLNPASRTFIEESERSLARREADFTRNQSVSELKRRADAGDTLAARYLSAIETGAIAPGPGFGSYLQELSRQEQFNRQQGAIASREQAKLDKLAEQAKSVAEYLQSEGREDLAKMVLAYPQMSNNILQSIASNQLQSTGFRPATPEEAETYGAIAGQIDTSTGRFYPTQKVEMTEALTTSEKSKAQNALLAYQSISPTITEYKRLVAQGGLGIIPGTQQDVLKQTQTNLMLQMKELFNLGVLNGPDLDLMEKMVYDVTSPANYATSVIGGQNPRERFVANMENLERQLKLLAEPKIKALSNVFDINPQGSSGASPTGFSITGTVGEKGT